jgi:FkbM family methyltransferase
LITRSAASSKNRFAEKAKNERLPETFTSMLKRIIDPLRPVKRRLTAPLASLILRFKILESAFVRLAHIFPNLWIVHWLCYSIRKKTENTPHRFRVVSLKSGAKMLVDLSDLYKEIYFCGVDYEPETTRIILEVLRPGDVVFDIGANAGYYTFLMAGITGESGQVHSFEPNPALANVLVESLKINGYRNEVVFNQIAVSDESEAKVKLFISQASGNSGLSSLHPHQSGIEYKYFSPDKFILVNTTTLDDYFQRHDLKRPDLVKIDVEFAEARVIKGMTNILLKQKPKFIICETSLHGETDSILRSHGFSAYIPTKSGLEEAPPEAEFWGNIFYISSEAAFEGNETGI